MSCPVPRFVLGPSRPTNPPPLVALSCRDGGDKKKHETDESKTETDDNNRQVSEKFDLVYHEAYCFITWMPENIPAFVKARVSTHQVSERASEREKKTDVVSASKTPTDRIVYQAGIQTKKRKRACFLGHQQAEFTPFSTPKRVFLYRDSRSR